MQRAQVRSLVGKISHAIWHGQKVFFFKKKTYNWSLVSSEKREQGVNLQEIVDKEKKFGFYS